jgi:hypothetical protein
VVGSSFMQTLEEQGRLPERKSALFEMEAKQKEQAEHKRILTGKEDSTALPDLDEDAEADSDEEGAAKKKAAGASSKGKGAGAGAGSGSGSGSGSGKGAKGETKQVRLPCSCNIVAGCALMSSCWRCCVLRRSPSPAAAVPASPSRTRIRTARTARAA